MLSSCRGLWIAVVWAVALARAIVATTASAQQPTHRDARAHRADSVRVRRVALENELARALLFDLDDGGDYYEQGRCTARTTDSGAADAASYAGDAGSCGEDPAQALGGECSDASGCNCAAPYCAIMPGQATGVCTRMCQTTPDDCPERHRCFDLPLLGVTGIDPFCIEG